jgi:dihydropteroate synthase
MARVLRHSAGALALDPAAPAGGASPLLMGVVNVTPDSFSDGGRHLDPADAVAGALRLATEGAAILDVGGESSRPGHEPVDAETEWARVAPVLEALSARPDLPPVSIDTTKAEVARRALAAGAAIVNDIWGFQRDPDLAAVTAEAGAGCVLMHNRDRIVPEDDIVEVMLRFFETSLAIARRAGIAEEAIVLDPGLGFGQSHAQNFHALAGIGRLKAAFGLPVLVGASRKSFIGRLFEPQPPPSERLPGTIAAHLAAAARGADILRVHDVSAHAQALRVAGAIERGGP